MSEARQAAERASDKAWDETIEREPYDHPAYKWLLNRDQIADMIESEFAPLLAAKDAEIAALEDRYRHFRDGHAKIARGVKAALGLQHWPEFTGTFQDEVARLVSEVVSERDKQAVELREMRRLLEKIAEFRNDCGCVPCTGRCRSKESLEIVIENMVDAARSALERTAYLEQAGEAE